MSSHLHTPTIVARSPFIAHLTKFNKMSTVLRAAILIVSDTAAKDASTDKGIPALQGVFAQGGQFDAAETKIVSDDVLQIQRAVQQWTDTESFFNLIVTSGGTGFAQKDHTPEAIAPLIHKHAPGIVHAMLAASFAITPFAAMARPVAGVRNNSLIITLPGSPKGAKENLEAVLKLLPHACQQAAGIDSRTLHIGGVKKLEKEAGVSAISSSDHTHSHGHHHGHTHDHGHGHGHRAPQPHTTPSDRPALSNDPNAGPTRRHRESPYPMLSVADALAQIAAHTPSPTTTTVPVNASLIGHVLAADVSAPEAVPAFRASTVDGYAVIAPTKSSASSVPSTKGVFPVVAISHAQAGAKIPALETGTIARITTGAPLPPSANAVVMVEDTVLRSRTEDGSEEREVEVLTDAVVEGENVREVGSDVKAGEVVMRQGEGVTAVGGELGLLASVGVKEVQVYRKPRVGVLSTGDEIVDHDREGELRLGEVRDTNRPTLITAARASGFEVVDLGIASDR